MQDRLILERLPAYAPELNLVETLWWPIKAWELENLADDPTQPSETSIRSAKTIGSFGPS